MTRLERIRSKLLLAGATLLAGCAPSDEPATGADGVSATELQLPPGFEAMVVFGGTGESREIYVREDGDIFVSLAGLSDAQHILGLRDEDGDYVIDTVQKFYHLKTPES